MTSIAIRLPEGLVEALDRLVESGHFTSRSEAVRGAIDLLVSSHERVTTDRLIVESYTRDPQSDEELAVAREALRALVEDEPW